MSLHYFPLFLRKSAVVAALLLACACNQSQADQFITVTGEIVAGVQTALPIIDLFVPPPYNTLEPIAASLLNQVNAAAANIANAAATNGTALSLTQVVIQNISSIVLDPTVLKQFPTSIQGPNGLVNTQALIQSLITLLNNELAMAAHQQGMVVIVNPANAINTVEQPPTPAFSPNAIATSPVNQAKAKLATTQVKMSTSQMDKINDMLGQIRNNAAVLAAAPSAATVRSNQAIGRE